MTGMKWQRAKKRKPGERRENTLLKEWGDRLIREAATRKRKFEQVHRRPTTYHRPERPPLRLEDTWAANPGWRGTSVGLGTREPWHEQ